jgi:hypothetical protein
MMKRYESQVKEKKMKGNIQVQGWVRFFEYRKNYLKSFLNSKISNCRELDNQMCFILGCGRSGTTILGKMIAANSKIIYLNEARELWASINRDTDIWGYLNTKKSLVPSGLMKFADNFEKERFANIAGNISKNASRLIVEKSPENLFRIPWLNSLCPTSKFVYIERNFSDVIKSIVKEGSFNIKYGFRVMNNWYGLRDIKKKYIKKISQQLELTLDIYQNIKYEQDWAALEWLCSVTAANKFLGNMENERVFKCRYEELVNSPEKILIKIFSFLNISVHENELEKARNMISKRNSKSNCKVYDTPLIRHIEDTIKSKKCNYDYTECS